MKVTVLGCGNSGGTPLIGNNWGKCDPEEPKNRRGRCSVAVQTDATTIIVDTGPDFREQLNRENITEIDHVLYTHPHGDHLHGIDKYQYMAIKTQ
jgi:phosphoribosyl 1,2-cyclic phosphate phosphodiesterase